ncbi:MAG TPA: hypothetical protein VF680_11565 [Allosphingosinicella sp.]|jgi:gp16 family phage-associated protein
MEAESLFPPISKEAIRRAKSRLALDGESVGTWASRNGFAAKTVYQVLSGSRRCIRGESARIAFALGLRPLPDDVPAPVSAHAATVATAAAAGSCDRRFGMQLGEPVR